MAPSERGSRRKCKSRCEQKMIRPAQCLHMTLRVECTINLCRNRSCRSLTCYLNTSQSSGSWNEGNSIFTYVRFIRTPTCSVTFERVRIPRLRHHRVWQIVRSCFIAPVVFHSPARGYPAFPPDKSVFHSVSEKNYFRYCGL